MGYGIHRKSPMSSDALSLEHPPIIEAVLDLNCDMPPAFDLEALAEVAKERFSGSYPLARKQVVEQHEVRVDPEAVANYSSRHEIGALQFLHDDEKQIVQVRREGYSFNRLAPYEGLDTYLPEVRRTWSIFREMTGPVQIRQITLRFINRILLPLTGGQLAIADYFGIGPELPGGDALKLTGFVRRDSGVEVATGNQVNVGLLSQRAERDALPVIFDIEAYRMSGIDPEDWRQIEETILSLRMLKNMIFERTLTEKCLNLFRRQ